MTVCFGCVELDRGYTRVMKKLVLVVSHLGMLGIGFALGIYALPILIAPPAPTGAEVAAAMGEQRYSARFERERADSDAFHFGEGIVSIGESAVTFEGALSPGPDYRLYFSPEFVETEAGFERLKSQMRQVGMVSTFDNFIVPLPADFNPDDYDTVIVWCESFGQFITSAQYR